MHRNGKMLIWAVTKVCIVSEIITEMTYDTQHENSRIKISCDDTLLQLIMTY